MLYFLNGLLLTFFPLYTVATPSSISPDFVIDCAQANIQPPITGGFIPIKEHASGNIIFVIQSTFIVLDFEKTNLIFYKKLNINDLT